ncbi:MAG: hypothetical protein OSA98_06440 [Rubripirellula sp.]|nr:hypothetical protein [Rubripirellula sp.]
MSFSDTPGCRHVPVGLNTMLSPLGFAGPRLALLIMNPNPEFVWRSRSHADVFAGGPFYRYL